MEHRTEEGQETQGDHAKVGVFLDLKQEYDTFRDVVLDRGEHIRTGAEARIYHGSFLGFDVIIKERYPRTYRVRELDEQLRKKRVRSEARILVEARLAGVRTPRVLDLDLDSCTIIMEFLPFPSLKEVLVQSAHLNTSNSMDHSDHGTSRLHESDENDMRKEHLIREAGRLIGLLHSNDLTHGDLTTSNILVESPLENEELKKCGDTLWFIDFGLAEKTTEIEDKGVDLHVFVEAFESTHSYLMDLIPAFFEGYLVGNPGEGEDVVARLKEIAKRGRYS